MTTKSRARRIRALDMPRSASRGGIRALARSWQPAQRWRYTASPDGWADGVAAAPRQNAAATTDASATRASVRGSVVTIGFSVLKCARARREVYARSWIRHRIGRRED